MNVVVAGTLVRSRRTPCAEGPAEAAALRLAVSRLNARYRCAVVAEFQVVGNAGFIGTVRRPQAVPDILQDLRDHFPRARFRITVRRGRCATAIESPAIGSHGIAFAGFGADDVVLDGIAGLLAYHWTHLEDSQRQILTALRDSGAARKCIAGRLGISAQALSNRAQSAGAREYCAGMRAWRTVLARHELDESVARDVACRGLPSPQRHENASRPLASGSGGCADVGLGGRSRRADDR